MFVDAGIIQNKNVKKFLQSWGVQSKKPQPVTPVTFCKGLFNQIHRKFTFQGKKNKNSFPHILPKRVLIVHNLLV